MHNYNGGPWDNYPYLDLAGPTTSVGGTTSIQSSTNLSMNLYGYANEYQELTDAITWNIYPVHDPSTPSTAGDVPVDLDVQEVARYKTQECQSAKDGKDKDVPLHVLLRRRAQNRASQRAFRHRKDKRMKEIGEQLADLQERHNELTQSYDTLQLEYSAIKEEMETFRRKYESSSISRSYLPVITGWNTQQAELGEQLPFDSSVLLHGPKPGGSQEESGAYDLDSIISK